MPLTTDAEESCSPDYLIRAVRYVLKNKCPGNLAGVYYTEGVLFDAIVKANRVYKQVSSTVGLNARTEMDIVFALTLLAQNGEHVGSSAMLLERGASEGIFLLLNTPKSLMQNIFEVAFVRNYEKALNVFEKFFRVEMDIASITTAIPATDINYKAPLLMQAVSRGQTHLVRFLLRARIPLESKDADGYDATHYLSLIPKEISSEKINEVIRLLVAPDEEYKATGLELNRVVHGHSPLSFAVDEGNAAVVDELFAVSKQLKKSLFQPGLSLWNASVDSSLENKAGEDVALRVVQAALDENEQLPVDRQRDVLGSHSNARHSAEFLSLAIRKRWPRMVKLVLDYHPGWVNLPSYDLPIIAAIRTVKKYPDKTECYFILWNLVLYGVNLFSAPREDSPGTTIKMLNKLNMTKVRFHLASVSLTLLMYVNRIKNTPKRVHLNKKPRLTKEETKAEEKPKASELKEGAERGFSLVRLYGEKQTFFATLNSMTAQISTYSHLTSDCILKIVAFGCRNKKTGEQVYGSYSAIALMIFRFLDVSEFLTMKKKENQKTRSKDQSQVQVAKFFPAPIDAKLHHDFVNTHVKDLMEQCVLNRSKRL